MGSTTWLLSLVSRFMFSLFRSVSGVSGHIFHSAKNAQALLGMTRVTHQTNLGEHGATLGMADLFLSYSHVQQSKRQKACKEPLSHVGVSINGGAPQSSIFIACALVNHPFWGTPMTMETPML